MKHRLFLAALLAVGLAAAAGRAQERSAPDGFAICPFAGADATACEPLGEPAMQRFGLTAEDRAVVENMRRYAATPTDPVLADLAKPFAGPQPTASTDNGLDYWLAARETPACAACGVHLRFQKNDLFQMTYSVERKFTVTWSRAAAGTPQR